MCGGGCVLWAPTRPVCSSWLFWCTTYPECTVRGDSASGNQVSRRFPAVSTLHQQVVVPRQLHAGIFAGRVTLFVPRGYDLKKHDGNLDTFYLHAFLILTGVDFQLKTGVLQDCLPTAVECNVSLPFMQGVLGGHQLDHFHIFSTVQIFMGT